MVFDPRTAIDLARTLSSEAKKRQTKKASSGLVRWKRAMQKLKERKKDPWEDFHLEKLEERKAKRLKFDAKEKKWIEDEVLVKLDDSEPFAKGAMRQCFRMKEMTTHLNVLQVTRAHRESSERDELWRNQKNYVAKEYLFSHDNGRDLEIMAPSLLVEDVKMQMEAKMYAEAFNARKPPKAVDMLETFLLQLRDTEKWFLVESYQEGKYCKHNNNAGFVGNVDMSTDRVEHIRSTPQAFSYFTFCESGGKLIIVDIQGVGDLYTDPQIHTVDGTGYGAGNIGKIGIAKFFDSFDPDNPVARKLGLPSLAQPEHHTKEVRGIYGSLAAATCSKSWQMLHKSQKGKPASSVNLSAISNQELMAQFNSQEPTILRDVHVWVGKVRLDAGDVHGAQFHWLEAARQGSEVALKALRCSRRQWLKKIVDQVANAVTSAPAMNVMLPAIAHTDRFSCGLFPFVCTRRSLQVISEKEGVMGWFRGAVPGAIEKALGVVFGEFLHQGHPGWYVFHTVVTYPLYVMTVRMILLPKQKAILDLETLTSERSWIAWMPNLLWFAYFGDIWVLTRVGMTRSVLPGASGSFIDMSKKVVAKDGVWGLFAGVRAGFWSFTPCFVVGLIGSIPLRLLSSRLAIPDVL